MRRYSRRRPSRAPLSTPGVQPGSRPRQGRQSAPGEVAVAHTRSGADLSFLRQGILLLRPRPTTGTRTDVPRAKASDVPPPRPALANPVAPRNLRP